MQKNKHISKEAAFVPSVNDRSGVDPRLQTLAIEVADNSIIITDRQGLIQWANPAFTRMTGYSLDEVLGQSTRLLKSGLHPDEFYTQLWDTILSGEVWRGEVTNRRKDGSLYVEEQTITPVRDDQGEITHFIAVKQDVTAHHQAEQVLAAERQRFLNLLNELPAVIYLRDADYQIRFFNQVFRDRFGDPTGQPCYKVTRLRDEPCPDCPNLNQVATIPRLQSGIEERQGQFYQIYHYLFQDTDGTNLVLQMGIDITPRMQAEALLEENNLRLQALSQAERIQRQRAEGLSQAAQALSSSLNLDEVLDHILIQVQAVIPYYAAGVFLMEDDHVYLARHRGIELPQSLVFLAEGFSLYLFPMVQQNCIDRRSVLIEDTRLSGLWRPLPGLEWARSSASVPLISAEQVYGLLILLSEQASFFDQDQLHLLEAFAAHAVQAIRNARLFQAEQLARHISSTLAAASLALSQKLDLPIILDTFLEFLNRLAPYDCAMVWLLQGDQLVLLAERGAIEQLISPPRSLELEAHLPWHKVVATKHSLLIPDTALEPDWKPVSGLENISTCLSVPLIAGEKVIGVCGLGKIEPNSYDASQLQWMEALAGQAATIIQNAQLFTQVQAGSEYRQALSRRLVEVQESERRYVARELHDEASQALTSLKLRLGLLEREAGLIEKVQAGIAELKGQVEQVMENLHRLAADLRPSSLDHLGLEAALRQYTEAIALESGMQVQFESLGLDRRLSLDTETALYRIVQEAMSNVVLHAQATRADVLLERRADQLVLIVEDDGIGMDVETAIRSGRLGLFGIRERAEMLGGDLTIESNPGSGTTIYVEVPYDHPGPVSG